MLSMRRALRAIDARLLPRGWSDVFRQLLLCVVAYMLYELVRGLVSNGNLYKPFGDAMRIIDVERAIHIFVEPSINAWVHNTRWLMDVADWVYLNGHFFVTISVLVFIYLRRNDSFYFVRNVLIVSMAIGLVGYWLYPTAPPRLMPEWGFTDTVSQLITGGKGYIENTPAGAFVNTYAAVPSMHICFALIIGVSMARLVRRRPFKILWYLYPLLVTFVVVATANHFFIDVFLGALTAVAAALIAKRLLARALPEKWAFAGQVPA
jgi:membrane-associated phospholipid phosphatase